MFKVTKSHRDQSETQRPYKKKKKISWRKIKDQKTDNSFLHRLHFVDSKQTDALYSQRDPFLPHFRKTCSLKKNNINFRLLCSCYSGDVSFGLCSLQFSCYPLYILPPLIHCLPETERQMQTAWGQPEAVLKPSERVFTIHITPVFCLFRIKLPTLL